MAKLKLTYQLHGPDDATIFEGMVSVDPSIARKVTKLGAMEELVGVLTGLLTAALKKKAGER